MRVRLLIAVALLFLLLVVGCASSLPAVPVPTPPTVVLGQSTTPSRATALSIEDEAVEVMNGLFEILNARQAINLDLTEGEQRAARMTFIAVAWALAQRMWEDLDDERAQELVTQMTAKLMEEFKAAAERSKRGVVRQTALR